jgi:hypothetical protein
MSYNKNRKTIAMEEEGTTVSWEDESLEVEFIKEVIGLISEEESITEEEKIPEEGMTRYSPQEPVFENWFCFFIPRNDYDVLITNKTYM